MIIKCLLRKYIPLDTKGVSEISLNALDIVNILIGRNGHGKSRILAELNELPADPKNYLEGGCKILVKEHLGKKYFLESHFGEHNYHSFKDEKGVEYNPNGTSTVQKDLVKKFFGLTPLTNRILSGLRPSDRFTLLPEAVRKDFFMELYPNDTKYALGYYDRMRQALNDCTGAIRNQTKRLAEEKQRAEVIASKTTEELEKDIAEIDSRISDALFIQGELSSAKNVSVELGTKIEQMKRLTAQILSFQIGGSSSTPGELKESIIRLEGCEEYHQDRVKVYQALLAEISAKVSGVKMEEIDPKHFEKQIQELTVKRDILFNKERQSSFPLTEHPIILQIHDNNDRSYKVSSLIRFINNIPPTTDETLTQGRLRAAGEKLNKLKAEKEHLESAQYKLGHTLKHFDNADQVVCPECTAGFKPGFDLSTIAKTRKEFESNQAAIATLEERIAAGERYVELHAEWDHGMSALTNYLNMSNDQWLNDLVSEYKVGYQNPDNLISLLNLAVDNVKYLEQLVNVNHELSAVQGRFAILKDNNMEEVLSSYSRSEALLGASTESLFRIREKISDYKYQLDQYNGYGFKVNALGVLKDEITDLLVEEGRHRLCNRIQELIADFSPMKDSYITALIRKQSYSSVIQSIEDNLAQLTTRKNNLKILTDGLCPKKGLIGRMMLDFIKTVCGNINSVIQEVWSTPLYIKPCLSDKGVLDYKFPVVNGERNSTSPDISFCSGGESEIINFALMKVARQYHRADVPLFSDEFGVMMDEYHRRRFFSYLHQITSTGEIDQLFLVSHYHSEYGMLKGANIIALNTEGLTVPADTNRLTTVK